MTGADTKQHVQQQKQQNSHSLLLPSRRQLVAKEEDVEKDAKEMTMVMQSSSSSASSSISFVQKKRTKNINYKDNKSTCDTGGETQQQGGRERQDSNMSEQVQQHRISAKSESESLDYSTFGRTIANSNQDSTNGSIRTKTKKRRQPSGTESKQQPFFTTKLSGSPDLTCLHFNDSGTLQLQPSKRRQQQQQQQQTLSPTRKFATANYRQCFDSQSFPVHPLASNYRVDTSITEIQPISVAASAVANNDNTSTANGSAPFSREGMLQEFRDDSYRSCITTLDMINQQTQDTNSAAVRLKKLSASPVVRNWRYIVLSVLVVSMIGTASVVYQYMSSRERKEFDDSFRASVRQATESFGKSLELTLESIDILANSVMTFAKYTNQTWPMVSMADFALHASKTRQLAKAVVLNMYPYVTLENRFLWERYTARHHEWVNASFDFQEHSDDYYGGPIPSNYTSYNVIHGYEELEKPVDEQGTVGTDRISPPYYLPMWQSAPVIPTYPPYNWDLVSSLGNNDSSVYQAMLTQSVVFSHVYNIPSYGVDVDMSEIYMEWFKPYVPPDFDTSEPVADIYYPMFTRVNEADGMHILSLDHDGAEHYKLHNDNTDEYSVNNQLPPDDFVGIMAVSVFWHDLIQNLIGNTDIGLHVVFKNPCNPVFTYELIGSNATYLGLGDKHDNRSNGLVETIFLFDMGMNSSTSSTYSGIPVNHDYCPYTLFLYPTAKTRDHFLTNQPLLYTYATLAIFAFTSLLFLIYNYWVEHRQRQIMVCAIRESVNANELDKIVQYRTEALQKTNKRLELANNKIKKSYEMQLEHFACMSHEIRTPLNGINGLSGIVCDDMKRLAKLIDSNQNDVTSTRNVISSSLEAMQIIVSSGELLRTIVDDVLDFAKLGSGKVEIDKKPNVALQEVLDTVIASVLCIEMVRTKQLSIHTAYDSNVPPYVTTDSRRLQQILYNLLGNAVKFSGHAGIVELSVQYLQAPKSGINGISTARLRFKVKDYGKGIPKDKFEAIFEPFIQAEGARTEIKHGGTGLGLAITSRLVDSLGGRISVDSVVGRWTKFSVDFLLKEDDCSEKNSMIRHNTLVLQNCVMCLVDDNDHTREQMERTFRHLNIQCIACRSFDEIPSHVAALSRHSDLEEGKTPLGIVMVKRDLIDEHTYEKVALNKYCNLRVITFTSDNESTDEKSSGQFPSLVRILPIVLLDRIAKYVQENCHPVLGHDSLHGSQHFKPSITDIRILVAEDNKVNQKVIGRILQRLNVNHVVIVGDGQQAVEREAIEQFDVILMDMHMPVLDGMDACHQIMARDVSEGHPRAKIVFLTALVSESFKEQCFAAGAVGFLSKPCTVKSVEECLGNIALSQGLDAS